MRINNTDKNDVAGYYKTAHAHGNANRKRRQVEPSDDSAPERPENLVEDIVDISEDAEQKVQKSRDKKKDWTGYYQTLSEELEKAREQGEGMAEAMKERIKCLRIAMSIMSGDKVPKEDLAYLAEKDPELYAKAIMMKKEKEDPREQDRVSEDEEAKEGSNDSADTKSRPASTETQTEVSADTPDDTQTESEAQ